MRGSVRTEKNTSNESKEAEKEKKETGKKE
jgi:hypothetical protein